MPGRKTRKHTAKDHVQTIPELRRAFEYIEEVGYDLARKPMKTSIPAFQAEWKATFYRELEHDAAKAYLEHLKTLKSAPRTLKTRRLGKKMHGGTQQPIAGAPLDYTTRAGLYTPSAAIPPNSYAQVPAYIQSGFWNPEQSHSYDPVPGQTHYVTATPSGLGLNNYPDAFGAQKGGSKQHGSKQHRTSLKKQKQQQKQQQGGWNPIGVTAAALTQAFNRPIPSSAPPSFLQNIQTSLSGSKLGASPDASQPNFQYRMSPVANVPANLAVSSVNKA